MGDSFQIDEMILDDLTAPPPTPAATATTAAPPTTVTPPNLRHHPNAVTPTYTSQAQFNTVVVRLNQVEASVTNMQENVIRHIDVYRDQQKKELSAMTEQMKMLAFQAPCQNYRATFLRDMHRCAGNPEGERALHQLDPNLGEFPPPPSPGNRLGTGQSLPLVRAELLVHKKPHNLWKLWQEWTHGIGGLKPAKDFTRAERGKKSVKSKFSRRMNFWRCISMHVSVGIHANVAIARVIAAYPGLTVSRICSQMGKDKQLPGGYHSELLV